MSRLDYIKKIKLKEISWERISFALKVRIKDIPHRLSWNLNLGIAKNNKQKIKTFHNIHKGKRCFIIANGPSLKKTDLSFLKGEFTIGMNRIYLSEKEMGFVPNYIVVHDIAIQLEQFRDDLNKLDLPKFFNWNARKLFDFKDNLTFIRSGYKPHFSTDLTKSSWAGHSVTGICIQLAYYMGFSEVYLIGKDHSYAEKGTPGKVLVSSGKESNHFVKGYYNQGMKWKIPDYKGEELAYTMARKTFENDNRIIKDATIDGKLNIFEKVEYESLFN